MTIYDDITRLQELSQYGTNVGHHAREIREAITSRAQQALEIIGLNSEFSRDLEEIKELAAEEERRVNQLNATLSAVIFEEARRMLGGAG